MTSGNWAVTLTIQLEIKETHCQQKTLTEAPKSTSLDRNYRNPNIYLMINLQVNCQFRQTTSIIIMGQLCKMKTQKIEAECSTTLTLTWMKYTRNIKKTQRCIRSQQMSSQKCHHRSHPRCLISKIDQRHRVLRHP